MTLPAAAEIEHADWPALKEHAIALGLNPKGRSGIVRQRILDHLRASGTAVAWHAGKSEQAALLTRLGAPDVAVRLWESTIRLDSPAPWVGLGTAYEKAGKLEEAMKCFDRAIQMGDDTARLHKAHALAYGGAAEAALAELDVAIGARPSDLRPWSQRAEILESIGRRDEAIVAYARIGDLAGNRLGLVRTLMKALRFEEAESALAIHLADHPRDAIAWNYRGACLAKRERWNEALKAFQQAVGLAGQNTVVLNNVACVLAAMGKTGEARRKMRAARRLAGDSSVLRNEAALLERSASADTRKAASAPSNSPMDRAARKTQSGRPSPPLKHKAGPRGTSRSRGTRGVHPSRRE